MPTKGQCFARSWVVPTLCLLVIMAAAIVAAPAGDRQQAKTPAVSPVRMDVKTSSDQARSLFREAVFEAQNVGGARALRAIEGAVKADPTFATARAFQAVIGPGDAATREKAVSAVLADMSANAAPEVLFVLYMREAAGGRTAQAIQLVRALADIVPTDPDIGWFYVNSARAGRPTHEQVKMATEFLTRFPGHAAARNQLGYLLYADGDGVGALKEFQEYLKLAPNHPNASDSMCDILMLLRRPKEALPHVQKELEIIGPFPEGIEKLGAIALMEGDAPKARAEFARALEIATTPGARLAAMHWTAASYAFTGDGQGAIGELTKIAAAAQEQKLPAAVRTAHERMAVVEAYLGDPKAVAAHLDTSASETPSGASLVLRAIALARIGDLEGARKAAAQLAKMGAAFEPPAHTLQGLIALHGKDLAAAEKELALGPRNDLFTKAVRADLLMRQGQKDKAAALRKEVQASTIKVDGNPPVDYFKLAAKMHADKL